jgi:hypothetical protein
LENHFMSTLTAKERLENLKAQFAPAAKKENNFTKFYNFWKMAEGETAIVRFLPDSNKDNERQFLVENLTHTFTINGKKRVVACLEMYDGHGSCPACELSRQYYQADGKESVMGKKYYRKKEYLGQVHVVQSPIEFEKNEGHDQEMPIGLGPQIFKLIQAAFASGDLEEIPYEFKGGYDFRIIKSEQGGNANYTLSKFAPKQTDLSEDVVANLNLYDLATLRNRKTDKATMEAMIIADSTGQPLVTPQSAASDSDAMTFTKSSAVAAAVASAPVVEEDAEVSTSAPAASDTKVNDVLAQIRARAAAAKAA